jgi:purine-nucleoside phosphorylase
VILQRLGTAKIALVLGSGLGPFVDYMQDTRELDYRDIPHMPTTSVPGHKGKLVLGTHSSNVLDHVGGLLRWRSFQNAGTVSGKRIMCLAGRSHAYEGYFMHQLTFVARVMKRVGVELYMATNSAGGCQVSVHLV